MDKQTKIMLLFFKDNAHYTLMLIFSIPHGSLTSGIAVKYRTGEHVAIVCHEGFKLKHESNNKIVCRYLLSFFILLKQVKYVNIYSS